MKERMQSVSRTVRWDKMLREVLNLPFAETLVGIDMAQGLGGFPLPQL